jgi:hypothetical protein
MEICRNTIIVLLLSFSVGFGQTKSIEVSDLSFLKPKPFNFVKSTNKLSKVDTKFIQFLYIKTVCLDLSMQKKMRFGKSTLIYQLLIF